MDERDARHALNVSVISMMVGQQLELSAEDIKVLGIGALLHDVGERKLHRRYWLVEARSAPKTRLSTPAIGSGAGCPTGHPFLSPAEALRIIQLHHERIDGSGYPRQVSGEYLSLLTKIVMVADVYDDLVQPAPPKRPLTPSEALAYLFRHTQRTLPREIVVSLIQTLSVYPPGTIVELVNGAYGLVLNVNRQERLKPLVLVYTPAESESEPLVVNLMTDPNRAIAQRAARHRLSPRVLST
ncbi:MAG: HD domain-containing protein [Nitrospiraceae bacterium]